MAKKTGGGGLYPEEYGNIFSDAIKHLTESFLDQDEYYEELDNRMLEQREIFGLVEYFKISISSIMRRAAIKDKKINIF